MASGFARQVLAFLFVAPSVVVVSYGQCYRYSDDCDSSQVCCNHQCVYGSTCYGLSCTFDSDCSSGESCCASSCVSAVDCSGYFCSSISDCSSDQTCCYGTCRNGYHCEDNDDYDDYDPTPIIIGSLVGSIIFICLFSMCIYRACRRRQGMARPGRVIVGGSRVTTTVTVGNGVSEANTVRAAPVGYQQGYPYYPPPQYGQYQTAPVPPYSEGAPPPYEAVAQGTSAGVYTPHTTYGAVQTNPSQPK